MRHAFIGFIAASVVTISAAYAGPSTGHAGSVPAVQLAAATAPAESQSPPDATIEFSGGHVAAGIGFSWGRGTVNYQGADHAFKIAGLSIVDVGVSTVTANGQVYNLKKLSDLGGNYAAVAVGATLAGGGSVAYLRNDHGVVIKVVSTTQGLQFELSANGVTITLED